MKIEITITLDELLEISEVPLRKYLKNWQNDAGNPLEFDGDLGTCKIHAIGCINCEISLESEISEKKQAIDDIIELVNTVPDDTMDQIIEAAETHTVDEAIDEVVNQAREHGEKVKGDPLKDENATR